MKGFGSASFFRTFDHFVRPSDLNLDRSWSKDGVDWRRERHTNQGGDYGYILDVYVGTKGGRGGWSIAIVREAWWMGSKKDPARSSHWAQLISGNRVDALAWFKAQEPFR